MLSGKNINYWISLDFITIFSSGMKMIKNFTKLNSIIQQKSSISTKIWNLQKLNTLDLQSLVALLNLNKPKELSMMYRFQVKLIILNKICSNFVPTGSTSGMSVISFIIKKQLISPLNNKNILVKNFIGKRNTVVRIT